MELSAIIIIINVLLFKVIILLFYFVALNNNWANGIVDYIFNIIGTIVIAVISGVIASYIYDKFTRKRIIMFQKVKDKQRFLDDIKNIMIDYDKILKQFKKERFSHKSYNKFNGNRERIKENCRLLSNNETFKTIAEELFYYFDAMIIKKLMRNKTISSSEQKEKYVNDKTILCKEINKHIIEITIEYSQEYNEYAYN